jgi:hypothetical protein
VTSVVKLRGADASSPSPGNDKPIVRVSFEEAAVIRVLCKFARFHIGKGPQRLTGSKWEHFYSNPEVARFA